MTSISQSRRAMLRTAASAGVVAGASTLGLTACTTAPAPTPRQTSRTARRVLLAYFSRAGENYFNGGRRVLEVGNTEVIARRIQARIDCDVFVIRPTEPYPDSYDATVERNVREQDGDLRPEIADPMPSLARYDTVLIGSGIWNVRPPMIMSTFTERLDFTGLAVLPFVTYAVSGLGGTERLYRDTCRGARFGQPLAVRGEDVASATSRVDGWLRSSGLLA